MTIPRAANSWRTASGDCFLLWKRMSSGIGVGLLSLLLVGCAHHRNHTITSSFDEITSGERHTGGTFPQIYAASINGLLPFAEPGELYFYPKKRGILGAIGISSYTNHPCQGTVSYKLVRTYPSSATFEDLAAVRSNITQSASALIRAVRLQRAAAVLGASTDQTLQANAMHSQQESLKALAEAQASLAAVREGITHSNMVLFQWTARQKTAGGLKLGTLFSGSGKSEKSLQGYAIVAGFRTSTLFVGEDLIREIAENMTDWSSRINKGLGVPTFTIEGAKILYFSQSDLLKELQTSLKASASQFRNAPALLASIDQIELDFISQQLESFSNTGVVQGPAKVNRVPVPMSLPFSATKEESGEDYENWSPFYSVITRTKHVYEAMTSTQPNSRCECTAH